MGINVTAVKAFSDGNSVSVNLPYGSTCGDLASRVGAPSSAVYRINGAAATATSPVGEGDIIIISMGKADAGC